MHILLRKYNSADRIEFIKNCISGDEAYYELKKYSRRGDIITQLGYYDIAVAANNLVQVYGKYSFENPMSAAFGSLVYFGPDKRHVVREGKTCAAAKYACHFVTGKNEALHQRHYDTSKIVHLNLLAEAIQNACFKFSYLKENTQRIYYIYKVSFNNCIKIVCEPNPNVKNLSRIITLVPNQTYDSLVKKNTPIETMGVKPHD